LNEALAGLTDVIVSDLALTEMASALGRRTREQRLTRAAAQRLYREASKLHAASHRVELTPPIHRRAEQLMLTLAMPPRALDATASPVRCHSSGAVRKANSKSGFRSNDLPSGYQHLHFAAASKAAESDRALAVDKGQRRDALLDCDLRSGLPVTPSEQSVPLGLTTGKPRLGEP
jgi:hypothetical protein